MSVMSAVVILESRKLEMTKSDDCQDESGIGVSYICFQAFLSQTMTLADGKFAFTPALSHTLFIPLQGLVNFSISKLISQKSLSILMRVALARSLTAGETEGEKFTTVHHKRRWEPLCVCAALRPGCCLCV